MAMGDESGTIHKNDGGGRRAENNRPQCTSQSKACLRRICGGSACACQGEGRKDCRESYRGESHARTHAGACSSRRGAGTHPAAEQGRASDAD